MIDDLYELIINKIVDQLTIEEKTKAFELLSKEAKRMAMEIIINTRNTGVKDYPDGGYFSSKNKEISKPEKIVVTQIEKQPKKTVITKVEFLSAEELLRQEKRIREKREKYLKEELVKKHKYFSTADYYESDILDSYKESKICDEW